MPGECMGCFIYSEGLAMNKELLRPVAVSAHAVSYNGYFHRFVDYRNDDVFITYALIEDEEGCIQRVDMSYYQLKFLDRK